MRSKKGEMMELPFQMIFSIILIAVFLFSAVYGIRYFIERSEQMTVSKFLNDLEGKVSTVWQTTESSNVYSFNLPKSINKVCFWDPNGMKYDRTACQEFEIYREIAKSNGANVFFCPPEAAYKIGSPIYYKIDCQGNDCLKVEKNPYCIDNNEGVSIRLYKVFGKPDVYLK